MPITQLYSTWMRHLKQLCPTERKNRLANWGWLLAGLFLSRAVHLSRIASKIPTTAKLPSTVRRLSRLWDNAAVRVRPWYEPIARALLSSAAATTGEIRLLVDGSKVGFGRQLLIVALAFRRRAVPIAWTWVPHSKGHSSAWKQRALLGYVHSLVPAGVPLLLVGDAEFGAVEVQEQLDAWDWGYVLRQKSNNTVAPTPHGLWQPLADLLPPAGGSVWWEGWYWTQAQPYRTNLLAYWQAGEKTPWLLATHLPTRHAALAAYRRRMWIDEMFGDFKGNGFDLERTHLRHFSRLSRLTLAVVLLYVWLVVYGIRVIKSGQRDLGDRADRRDLSVFRIGWHMVERHIALSLPLPVRFCFHL